MRHTNQKTHTPKRVMTTESTHILTCNGYSHQIQYAPRTTQKFQACKTILRKSFWVFFLFFVFLTKARQKTNKHTFFFLLKTTHKNPKAKTNKQINTS